MPYQVLGKEEQVDSLIHDLQADIESMSSGVESPPSTIVAATIKNAAQQVTFEDSAESRWENWNLQGSRIAKKVAFLDRASSRSSQKNAVVGFVS